MEDTVRVRVAAPGDVPFLRRMEWEAVQASPRFVETRGIEHLRRSEEQRWSAWPGPDEVAFVAEDAGGEPTGAAILRVHEREGERVVGYRLAVAVEQRARGCGIGRALIGRAQEHVRASGAGYLLLQVDTSNDGAIRVYRAAGFELGDQYGVVPMIVRYR